MKLKLQLGVEVEVKVRVQLLVRVGGWWVRGWSDKTKVILNSTQFKLKLKLWVTCFVQIGVCKLLSTNICYFNA